MALSGISPYYGEMLTSPVPLEMSLNVCSSGCAYCFSVLNDRHRQADVPGIMNLLKGYQNLNSFEAQLMRAEYPVLVSNRVDPFATSNYKVSIPILRVMTELGIPVTFQTRGGRGVDDVLAFLKPSLWYVSICTLDDSIRKKVEPGAPDTDSRFELIKKLKNKGHRVVIGFNPCVEQWQPDPTPLLAKAQKAGAEGCWIERLHFNSRQTTAMTDREKKSIGEFLIVEGRKKRSDKFWEFFMKSRQASRDVGLHTFSIYQPNESKFFDLYRSMYEKTFPTVQDLVNVCHQEKGPCLVTFSDFVSLMMPLLPEGEYPWGHCVAVTSGSVFSTHKVPNKMNTVQFLHLVWTDPRMKQSPARTSCFAYAVVPGKEGQEPSQLVDDQGIPVMAYTDHPDGFDSYYTLVDIDVEKAVPSKRKKVAKVA